MFTVATFIKCGIANCERPITPVEIVSLPNSLLQVFGIYLLAWESSNVFHFLLVW